MHAHMTHRHSHTHTLSCTQSQHHCSMKHKTPVGCWPGFPAPSIQCDHVLDRRKQKLRGAVSTSDGANPNLATLDTTYSRTLTWGFQLFIMCLQCALIKYDQMSFLKVYSIISGGLEMPVTHSCMLRKMEFIKDFS